MSKVLRWQIAEETGWTMDYIKRSLSYQDLRDYASIKDGKYKASR